LSDPKEEEAYRGIDDDLEHYYLKKADGSKLTFQIKESSSKAQFLDELVEKKEELEALKEKRNKNQIKLSEFRKANRETAKWILENSLADFNFDAILKDFAEGAVMGAAEDMFSFLVGIGNKAEIMLYSLRSNRAKRLISDTTKDFKKSTQSS